MKISRERLIDELALKNVEVRELRDEVASLKKELASYSKERRIIAERNSAAYILEDKLSRDIFDFPLSVRTINGLQRARIETVRDVVTRSQAELLKTKNFGRKSLGEVRKYLKKIGLDVGMAL